MKKIIFILSVILFTHTVSAQLIGSWATHKSLGNNLTSRQSAGMTSLNGKLYILGSGNGEKDFTEYNPITGEIVKLGNFYGDGSNLSAFLPSNRGCLFTVQGEIYVLYSVNYIYKYSFAQNNWTICGTYNSNPSSNPDCGFVINDTIYLCSQGGIFDSFNVTTNTWTALASHAEGTTQGEGIAFSINGKGYHSPGDGTGAFFEYNPATNTWTQKTSIPYGYWNAVGVACNGKGYVGSGSYESSVDFLGHISQFWHEYDPNTDTWTKKQNIINLSDEAIDSKLNVYNAAVATIGNDIFIFGGAVAWNIPLRDDILKYNVPTDNWQVLDSEPGKNRTEAFGFYTNGKIYTGGGNDVEYLTDFWEYDITTDNWTQKANIPGIGHSQRACAEINGKGYFVGGYFGGDLIHTVSNPEPNYLDNLIEYDPATNQWTDKAPYPGGKRRGMVALSYNGNLYAGCGFNGETGQNYLDFYKYDPTSNTWTSLAPVPTEVYGYQQSNRYFVLGDTAYISMGMQKTLKYSFTNNSWTTVDSNIGFINETNYTNQAFSYNGKGYVFTGVSTYGDGLWEYNTTTDTWSIVLNVPASFGSSTIIPTPQGVFFGFGNGVGFNYDTGNNSNAWNELKFNAAVSQQTGNFNTIIGQGLYVTPLGCGTGGLQPNQAHAVYDANGKLFAAVIGAESAGGGCLEVLSLDTQLPYRTATADFGNGFQETARFLNKNVNSYLGYEHLRLYYTTYELNKFVQDFNATYGTTKTLQDIKLVQYNSPNNDTDPLNNIGNSYSLYSPTLTDYGTDKYFQLNGDIVNGVAFNGELYPVLLRGASIIPTGSLVFCKGATVATAVGTTSLKFYAKSTGGTSLAGTTALATKTYYVTETIDSVESSPRIAISVTVNSLPTTPGTISTSDAVLCKYIGTTNEVTYTVPAVAGTTYSWSTPAGVNVIADASATDNSITVNFLDSTLNNTNIGGVGTISVSAVNSFGCSSSAPRSLVLTSKLPSKPTALVLSNSEILSGGSIKKVGPYIGTETVFTLTVPEAVSADHYRWELPAGVNQLSGGTGNVITVDFAGVASGVGPLTINVYSVGGCGESLARTLTLARALPTAPTKLLLTDGATTVTKVGAYVGNTTPLTLTATPFTTQGATATSFSWVLPSGVTVTAGATQVADNGTTKTYSGTATVLTINLGGIAPGVLSIPMNVFAVNGTGTSATARTLTVTSATPKTPGAITTPSSGVPTFNSICSLSIAVQVPNVSGVTYAWAVGSGASIVSGNGTNAIIINVASVTTSILSISVVASNGTGSSSSRTLVIKKATSCKIAPADIVADQFSVIAYPNPSSDEFTIETSSKGATIRVYDVVGRLIENRQATSNSVQVGKNYATGVYNVIVNQGTKVKTLRVIKK